MTVIGIANLFAGRVHVSDPTCESTIGWTDADGKNCLDYIPDCEENGGWPKVIERDPNFFDRSANNGITAQDACCQCGKGAANARSINLLRLAQNCRNAHHLV